MKKKKGFTLIELLAVIVILAIIALIAVPVIMNILNKANKSALKDTAYGVISAGELYFAEEQLDLNGMSEEKVFTFPTNEIEVKGNVPEGTVLKVNPDGEVALTMTNGRYCITKGYEENDITVSEDLTACGGSNGGADNGGSGNTDSKTLSALAVADLGLTVPACVTSGTCAAGTPIAIKVNDTTPEKFYVLSDDGNTVNLILNRNLYEEGNDSNPNVQWYNDEDNAAYGPNAAINALEIRTANWANISETLYTYSCSHLIEVESGYENRKAYEDITVLAKARMITNDEVYNIRRANNGTLPIWLYENLLETGDGNTIGYWTTDTHEFFPEIFSACYVDTSGSVVCDHEVTVGADNGGYNGVRPIITINK